MEIRNPNDQHRVDYLAEQMSNQSHGDNIISMEWGCVYFDTKDREVKMLLMLLASDYLRLRGIVKQMPPEQFSRYEKKLERL